MFVIVVPIGLIAFLASWVTFFPLCSAFFPENPVLHAPAVQETASRLRATPAQVALSWLLAQAPTVLLIPGTSSLSPTWRRTQPPPSSSSMRRLS